MGINPARPAAALMAAVVAAYADAGVPIPQRQYLAPGPLAAWDGEHVAVTLAQTLPGTADNTNRPGAYPGRGVGSVALPRATYDARVLRCVPTLDSSGDPPSVEELTACTELLLADLGVLLDASYRWAAKQPPGIVVTVGQATPLGPEGALAGYAVHCTASLV
ncbi:hypothetical protein [Pseudonocardia sp. NPDC049635]|uniref:hypothetical protein n=1 Tax=Pseudonocardia sp. NPDC049635 TaxID=3155506 RepID=UPI00340E8007